MVLRGVRDRVKKQRQWASDAALCHHAAACGKGRNTVAALTGPKQALC